MLKLRKGISLYGEKGKKEDQSVGVALSTSMLSIVVKFLVSLFFSNYLFVGSSFVLVVYTLVEGP